MCKQEPPSQVKSAELLVWPWFCFSSSSPFLKGSALCVARDKKKRKKHCVILSPVNTAEVMKSRKQVTQSDVELSFGIHQRDEKYLWKPLKSAGFVLSWDKYSDPERCHKPVRYLSDLETKQVPVQLLAPAFVNQFRWNWDPVQVVMDYLTLLQDTVQLCYRPPPTPLFLLLQSTVYTIWRGHWN